MGVNGSDQSEPTLLKRLLALGFGIVFLLLLLEGGIRIFGLSSKIDFEPNPFFGWSHFPNDEFTNQIGDSMIDIKINARGLRDREYKYEKPPRTLRILTLGDSFAEAFQVPETLSFAKITEGLLNSNKPDGLDSVQVINSGTSGYGTDNELLFFLHEGQKYHPDLVLLTFTLSNDVRNNWYRLDNVEAGGFRKPYFTFEKGELKLMRFPFYREENKFLSRIKLFLNRHVMIYVFAREFRNKMRFRSTVKQVGMHLDFNIYAKEISEDWGKAWEMTEALIIELRREVELRGAKFYVVLIPTQFQVQSQHWEYAFSRFPKMQSQEWDLSQPNKILKDLFIRENIPFLDLLDVFRFETDRTGKEFYIPNDGHWNAEGHALGGRLISESLIEQGVIKSYMEKQ